MDQQKYKTENKILRLSLGGTITFTVLEIIASFVLGSKTVMTDGIFDLFDLLLLLPMFILVPFLYKPVSEKKPYGFSQIESLLVLVKYIVSVSYTHLDVYKRQHQSLISISSFLDESPVLFASIFVSPPEQGLTKNLQ